MDGCSPDGLDEPPWSQIYMAGNGRTDVSESFDALIISSERENARILAARLGEHGITPTYCSPLDAEQTVSSRESVRLVFCDSRVIKEVYPSLRRAIQSQQRQILPVIFTQLGEAEARGQIKDLEDFEIIAPPFEGAVIEQLIQKAITSEESPKYGR
jgi:DNA-binding NtrC family response regulator